MQGLYDKYTITKTSGEAIDPEAVYFVLRLDTDDYAIAAVREYIYQLEALGINPELTSDLRNLLDSLAEKEE